ncbi:MAG: FkbM family methyltransferase [Bacteroidia bacterium]
MGLKEKLVSFLEGNTLTRNNLVKPIRDYRLDKHYRYLAKLGEISGEELANWEHRIEKVKISSDNARINKLPNAGELKGGKLIMHNGLKIDPLSYYGAPMLKMFMENKAVHEPQEEYVFQEVLKTIKPGAVMLELGCYWGFYSMWFANVIQDNKNFLIDNSDGIARAKANFALNNLKASFMEGYIGKDNPNSDIPVTNVDRICKEKNIEFIDVLHSDIQGFELEMLQTMPQMVKNRAIGYIFISTHSKELHYGCIDWLRENGYEILCHADLENSFSEDGLIVAKDPAYAGIDSIKISQLQEETAKV